MNRLYYTQVEIFGRDCETEVEYEYEPEEVATPTSPPYPSQVLIYSVRLMRQQAGQWVSVDIEPLLDSLQKWGIQEQIKDHIRRFDLPRPVTKRRSCILTDEREAA